MHRTESATIAAHTRSRALENDPHANAAKTETLSANTPGLESSVGSGRGTTKRLLPMPLTRTPVVAVIAPPISLTVTMVLLSLTLLLTLQ